VISFADTKRIKLMNAQNTVVTFKKTDEEFGGFSNMNGGFPVLVNGVRVRTSEHLYQALKFPDHPNIQREILEEPSPMVAKWIANRKDDKEKKKEGNKRKVRKDWESIQLEVMEFCLRVKLIYHWMKFGGLLRSTEGKDIFEIEARKGTTPFWGVIEDEMGFRGENHLGKLLMKLRSEFVDQDNESLRVLVPPAHLNLVFLGSEIEVVDRKGHLCQVGTRLSEWVAEVRP